MDYDFIVINGNNHPDDIKLFADYNGDLHGDIVIEVQEDVDMYDILVMAKLFKSKGDARKNWKYTGKNVPYGFSMFTKLGKLNNTLCILKPRPDERELINDGEYDVDLGFHDAWSSGINKGAFDSVYLELAKYNYDNDNW